MFEIEIVKRKGLELVESRLLHKKLEVKSYHSDWIRRRIENYEFEEGLDYHIHQYSKMSNGKKTGGKLKKDYLISMDMAKELAMLENNDIGKEARKYFIGVEKEFHKKGIVRAIGIEARKTLTDVIEQSGEQERMHNQGIANYTKMAYEVTGLKPRFMQYKKDNPKCSKFRETLNAEELKRVDIIESMSKSLIDAGKQYMEIKDTLKPIFKTKEIK